MKYSIQLFIISIFTLLSITATFSQDVLLESQADLDAFDSATTTINGNLEIRQAPNSTNPILNLSNLSNLTSISGELRIDSTSLQNIDGLSNLESVGGRVYIWVNPLLLNIDGLSSLDSITDYLIIHANASLLNIDGLSNLTTIDGGLSINNNNSLQHIDALSNVTSVIDLGISENPSLLNLDGLSNLTTIGNITIISNNISIQELDLPSLNSVGGFLNISENTVLQDIGLSNLSFIGGYLSITDNISLQHINSLSNLISTGGSLSFIGNDSLLNIDGLSSLDSIGGFITIADNIALQNINGLSNLNALYSSLTIQNNDALQGIDGLSGLDSFGGSLLIKNNDALQNIDGLVNISSIRNGLHITNNNALQHLDGLSNINSVTNSIFIEENDALLNIDGLANLDSIGHGLRILDNDTLQHLDGLSNLFFVGSYVRIKNNPSLTNCCGFKHFLENPNEMGGSIEISDNPSECSNGYEVLHSACGLSLKIFNDISEDCIDDNDEIGLVNRHFIIQPGDIVGETNLGGRWRIDSLPLGDYTLTIDTSGSWSPTCPVSQSFTVVDSFNASIIFGLASTEPCPAPDISIHMPFMRPCFENQRIFIQACNTSDATGLLADAFVIIELDSLLIPTSSSIPYIALGNNLYQFDLGTLNPGICPEFWMETTLSCDAELGQTLCIEANLFPAAECVFDHNPHPFPSDVSPCNTPWDMSSISVEGHCENDSIFFDIINSGSGDMTCFHPVRVYINGNLIILDSVQLVSNEIVTFAFSADGQSWRLEADQHPLHPGNSHPNALVEACGSDSTNINSFINSMSLDDADPVVDIYCDVVTGSYDPNDKTGFPLGVNESNDILPNQQMEYLIRFQNTGTDTAFTVVIRDTLSTDFDIFSVQSGVASHDYDFTMYGPRVMEWTFNNILLPDSTTNEAGSHGFIKFTVNQIPDLAEGTVLENSAGIYFDFNDPIITNTSQHTINYFTTDIIATTNISEEACDDYTSPSGDFTWINSGTYYDIIETVNGDSVIVIDLTVTSSETIIPTISGIGASTLMVNIPNAEYQWLDCNNNLNPIAGATGQEFTTMEIIGDYAVQITLDGCQVISDCFHLNTTGTEENEFATAINIHPNPTNNFVSVNLGKSYQGASFTLRNTLGQIIFNQEVNNTDEFQFEIDEAAGLYLLEIKTKTGKFATFRLLKK